MMYQKLLLQGLLFHAFAIVPIISFDLLGRNEFYRFSVSNSKTVNEKINLKLFRGKGRTIKAKLPLNQFQKTGKAKCRSASKVYRIEAWCRNKDTKCANLLENDIKTINLVKGTKNTAEKVLYCKSDRSQNFGFNFIPCFERPSTEKIIWNNGRHFGSENKKPTSNVLQRAGLYFRSDKDSDPYKAQQEFFDSCKSGEEMGTLLLHAHDIHSNIIEFKLNFKDICENLKSSLSVRFRYIHPISTVEANCEKPSGICYRLLKDDLHVMKLFYGEKNRCMEKDNYFCKREILVTGKHLYKRCGQELSTDALKQKKPDEYVHMMFLKHEDRYFKLGKPITRIRIKGMDYNIWPTGRNNLSYQFLASINDVDFLLIDIDDSDAHISEVAYLMEGSELKNFCFDENEKQLDNMYKFIQC